MDTVTLVIPAYNVAPYIDRCFESIRNQTYDKFLVLAINDGSTDETLIKLQQWALKDNRITVIDKSNEGVGKTRNLGLSLAQTPYVIFIDPDDYLSLDMLEKMITKAMTHSLDLVLCDYVECFEDSNQQYQIKMPKIKGDIVSLKNETSLITEINPAPWNKLIKTEVLKRSGVFFPTDMRSEDLVFMLTFLGHVDRVGICEEPLYYYLANRLNNVSSTYDERILDTLKAVSKIKAYYDSHQMMGDYEKEIEYVAIKQIMYELKKVPYIKDTRLANEITIQFLSYLDQQFPFWKKNKYYLVLKTNLNSKQKLQEKIYESRHTLMWYRKLKNR
ncbi:MAG: glycosyltransferase family 2 protein [Turicibacter sp.]